MEKSFAVVLCVASLILLCCSISPRVKAAPACGVEAVADGGTSTPLALSNPIRTDSYAPDSDRFAMVAGRQSSVARPVRMADGKRRRDRRREIVAARFKGHNPRKLPR